MRGSINLSEIQDGETNCPLCGEKIKVKDGEKCSCGVKLHVHSRSGGQIKRVNYCGPSPGRI